MDLSTSEGEAPVSHGAPVTPAAASSSAAPSLYEMHPAVGPDPAGGPVGEAGATADGGKGAASRLVRGIVEFLVAFALFFLVVVLLRMYVAEPYTIPSRSMVPTIEPGDSVYSEKLSVLPSGFVPTQGQVYTFTSPEDSSETLIKRVIAVQGQTVDLIDGYVYVDGVKLDEPYTHGQMSYAMNNGLGITYPYTVPDGCFWAMGDNRGNSSDSRVFGAVPISNIDGRAAYRYWPIFRGTTVSSDGKTTPVQASIDLGFTTIEFTPPVLNIGSLDYT